MTDTIHNLPPTITPGMLVRLDQWIVHEGGLLGGTNWEAVYLDTAQKQRQALNQMGYHVVLDTKVMEEGVAGVPFAKVDVLDAGGPVSGWVELQDHPTTKEPQALFVFQWYIADVADPEPAVLQAGWPAVAVAVTVVGGLLFGTYAVTDEGSEVISEHLGNLRELVNDTAGLVATIGVVGIALLLLSKS